MMYTAFDPLNLAHVEYFRGMNVNVASDMKGIVSLTRKKTIAGIVILDSWTGNSVQAHIRVTNPMCLRPGGLLSETARFVYDVAKRGMILGFLRSDNPDAIAFDKKIGFVEEHIIKDGYEYGVDCVILSMTPDQCKHYNAKERAA